MYMEKYCCGHKLPLIPISKFGLKLNTYNAICVIHTIFSGFISPLGIFCSLVWVFQNWCDVASFQTGSGIFSNILYRSNQSDITWPQHYCIHSKISAYAYIQRKPSYMRLFSTYAYFLKAPKDSNHRLRSTVAASHHTCIPVISSCTSLIYLK